MFPKNIFQVWYQGYNNLSQSKFKENVKNWKLLNDDWNYNFLDGSNLEAACEAYSEDCLTAYNKFNTLHVKVDLGKIVMLYLYGGIMIDMDMYALRSLKFSKVVNDIIEEYEQNNKPIMGVSKSAGNFVERMIQTYGNAVMISSPKNPLLKEWIDLVIFRLLNSPQNSGDYFIISTTCGPLMFSNFIKENLGNNVYSKIVEIDYTIFEPCLLDGKCDITDDTISVHKFELSWIPKKIKFAVDIYYYHIRSNCISILTIAVLSYLLYKTTKRR